MTVARESQHAIVDAWVVQWPIVIRIKRCLVYALSMLMFFLVYAFLGAEKYGLSHIALLIALVRLA